MKFLVNAVDMVLGNISEGTFEERSSEWRTGAPLQLAVQYDLLHLWMQRSAAKTESEQRANTAALRATLARTQSIPDARQAVVQHAETVALFLDAGDLADDIAEATVAMEHPALWRRKFGQSTTDEAFANLQGRMDAWRSKMNDLIERVAKTANAPLACEALFTRDLGETMVLSRLHIVAALTGRSPRPVPDALIERVRVTRDFAHKHEQIETALRAGIIEADLEALRGSEARGRVLAKSVYDKAAALRLADVARVAKKIVDGVDDRTEVMREASAGDTDAFFLSSSAEEEERKAQSVSEDIGMPIGLARECMRSQGAAARERRAWCRHLDLGDSVMLAESSFSNPISYLCSCSPRGLSPLIPSADWATQIAGFKNCVCEGCAERAPKADRGAASARATSR